MTGLLGRVDLPIINGALTGAGDRQGVIRHIMGNHRSRRNGDTIADGNWGHKNAIRTSFGAATNDRLVLTDPVIIGGDGSGGG